MANIDPVWASSSFDWNIFLTNQVAGRKITTENLPKLGEIGEAGGFITAINLQPLGNNIATVFRLYRRVIEGTNTNYHLILEQSLPIVENASATAGLPFVNIILPLVQSDGTGINEKRVLECSPNSVYFCALGTAVDTATGYSVNVRGGLY